MEHVIEVSNEKNTIAKKYNENQLLSISETLEDFKCLLPRYLAVKDHKKKFKKFCSRNRSQIWDLKMFNTGLISEGAKKVKSKHRTKEHYFNRTTGCHIIFEFLGREPNMSLERFIYLMEKYCSTITLTQEEHKELTKLTKKVNKKTIEHYDKAGVVMEGLEEYINSVELPYFII